MQLLYERLRQGEVQIIVGAQHVVPLPVYFIYLKYAVCLVIEYQSDTLNLFDVVVVKVSPFGEVKSQKSKVKNQKLEPHK
ncbi:hypothetical protein [Nostoc sp.]|uniref:hypothetical protein n=1 Tax=Nostoc sp. TaxID=1180 RepID=UPI002FFB2E71